MKYLVVSFTTTDGGADMRDELDFSCKRDTRSDLEKALSEEFINMNKQLESTFYIMEKADFDIPNNFIKIKET